MRIILAIAVGGGIGAVARYLMAGQVMRLVGGSFPYGTLAVNVLGGFVMGTLVELMALKWSAGPEMRSFLTVGVLGGFTTFSSFSLETGLMMERGDLAAAAAYVITSVALSILALFAGLYVVRSVLA